VTWARAAVRNSLAARPAETQDARVPGFEIPQGLAYPYGGPDPALNEWITELPGIVASLAQRWSLTLGRPYQPGGSASWVAPVRTAAGERAVLKVGWWHDEARHEADGLRVWDGRGTVRLLDSLVTGPTSALLLEACEPGTPLSQAMPPLERDVVVARLLRRLWIAPPSRQPFRPLTDMCDRWADRFDEQYATARAAGRVQLDPGIARAGIELFRSLPRTAERSVLLCTDLHHDNVLAAQREDWLVVDPKPYAGDPAYDPLQHMLNFPDRLAIDPAGLARRMAALLDLDAGRVHQWLFARCVQESVPEPRLRAAATRLVLLLSGWSR
jgi:streptomycin 6-kinase